MIISLYNFFYRVAIGIILLLVTVLTLNHLFLVSVEEYFEENGIFYSKMQGSLFDGISIYDLKYKDMLSAKEVQLYYNLYTLTELKPIINNIQTKDLFINMDNIPKSSKAENSFNIPSFKIINVTMRNTQLFVNKELYKFDFASKNINYNNKLNIATVYMKLHSQYANATINAKVLNSKVIGHSSNLIVSQYLKEKYLSFLTKVPNNIMINFTIDKKKISLHTTFKKLSLATNKNIVFKNQQIEFNYFIDKNSFSIYDNYEVNYLNSFAKIQQNIFFKTDGRYKSKLKIHLINFPKKIPFHSVDINVSGNTKHVTLDANASEYKLHMSSNDYKKFSLTLSNEKINLFKKDLLAVKTKAILHLLPLSIEGRFNAQDSYTKMDGIYTYKKEILTLDSNVSIKKSNKMYKKYHLAKFSPLHIKYIQNTDKAHFSAHTKNFNLSLFKKDQNITGEGNIASAHFNINTNLNKEHVPVMHINTKINSLQTFLSELQLTGKKDTTHYDGKITINSRLQFQNKLSIKNSLNSPWISIQTNSQNRYLIKNISLNSIYKTNELEIQNYQAEYKKLKFYSTQHSKIYFDINGTIDVEAFYLYDNLLLKGTMQPFQGDVKLKLFSDKFHIKTDSFNLKARTNISIDVQNSSKQVIKGYITLLDGNISYIPPTDYSVQDDDIIIVQDMKRQKKTNLEMDIDINATKAIKYKTKEVDINFIPHLTLHKQKGENIKYFGNIKILYGKITAKEKEFRFDKGETNKIIFTDENRLNPRLDLLLHYKTLDYKDIYIRITNKLNSPVLIFSSNPVMSQNDIMSYILFGEPANAVFDNTNGTKISLNYLLFGSGLKSMLQKSSGIKIDTLNILNNKNGTLGYEAGARINKNLRVIYKNDGTSSAVIQYGLTPTTRVDVDVHDTGQGIYFIYTKEFK